MGKIMVGDMVRIATFAGEDVILRAVSPIEPGDTFDVVWACVPEEWELAQAEGREPRAWPWPADSVEAA